MSCRPYGALVFGVAPNPALTGRANSGRASGAPFPDVPYSPPPSPVLGPNSTAFSRIGVVARQNSR